jgi:hypothetical protein
MLLQETKGVSCIGHLIEAKDVPELSLAVSARPHVEAQRNVAPFVEHLAGYLDVPGVLVAAKAVEDYHGRPAIAGARSFGKADDPC